MSGQWHSYPTAQEAARACAHGMLAVLEEALSGQATATIALSGGTAPKTLFEEMVAVGAKWDKVHLFWVDERAVPPTDPHSNYRLADELFIRPAHIPRMNLHRIAAELNPEAAAHRYADEIREFFGLGSGEMPHFDLIHCGVGADAHTASLFAGEPLIDDREGIVAAVYVQKLGQWRITMLPGVFLAARHTVFLVTGADKAEAVRAVFHGPYDPKQCPAQMASHDGRRVVWYLDDAAAALMD
jgi:6-phosphogluconolactonase